MRVGRGLMGSTATESTGAIEDALPFPPSSGIGGSTGLNVAMAEIANSGRASGSPRPVGEPPAEQVPPLAVPHITVGSDSELARRMQEVIDFLERSGVSWAPLPMRVRGLGDAAGGPVLESSPADALELSAWLSVNSSDREATRAVASAFIAVLKEMEEMGAAHGGLWGANLLITPDRQVVLNGFDTFVVPESAVTAREGWAVQPAGDREAAVRARADDRVAGWLTFLTLVTIHIYPSLWALTNPSGLLLGFEETSNLERSERFQRMVQLPHPVASSWQGMADLLHLPPHLMPSVTGEASSILTSASEFDEARLAGHRPAFPHSPLRADRKAIKARLKELVQQERAIARARKDAEKALKRLARDEEVAESSLERTESKAAAAFQATVKTVAKQADRELKSLHAAQRGNENKRESALAELAREVRNRHVGSVLSSTRIPRLPGIAEGTLSSLAASGFRTATDIRDVRTAETNMGIRVIILDRHGSWQTVHGLGQAKGSTLLAWRRSVEQEAEATAPQPSAREILRIERDLQREAHSLNESIRRCDLKREGALADAATVRDRTVAELRAGAREDQHRRAAQRRAAEETLVELDASELLLGDQAAQARSLLADLPRGLRRMLA